MKLKKLSVLLLSILALTSCGNGKPYTGCIVDNNGVVKDTVLDVYRASSLDSGEYTVVCLHFSKKDSGAQDKTISISDVKGIDAKNNVVSPLIFATSIGSWSTGDEMHNFASGKDSTFSIKLDEHGVYPDCYVCFDKGAVDKNVVIKVKDQALNHNLSNPTEIDL